MRLYRCYNCNSLVFRWEVYKWRWLPLDWRRRLVARRIRRTTRRRARRRYGRGHEAL